MTEGNAPPTDAPDDSIHPSDVPELAETLEKAKLIPWQRIDLECPPACVQSVGAAVEDAAAQLRCECGTVFRLDFDGEHRQRCPACKTVFRHLVVVQAEDRTPSATAEAMRAILEAQTD